MTAHSEITPAAMPRMIEPMGPALPQAGVIATRPATAPVTMPSRLGLPLIIHSANIQASAAAEVARVVLIMARAAAPLAAAALPALKPYQPTHSMEAPIIVMVRLCGGMAVVP